MKKRKAQSRAASHRAMGQRQSTLRDATPGAVPAALTEWRQHNAGQVRNVVPHEVEQEPIEVLMKLRWSKVEPNGNAFSLTIEFERLV